MNRLEQAIELALHAHAGQADKQDEPYILHALRVMLGVRGESARIVAVLHDVLEDTQYREAHLLSVANSAEVAAIKALTRDEGERYDNYIRRLRSNPLAAEVKVSDLRDNLGRINGINQRDRARLEPRYREALALLEAPPELS